MAAGWSLSCASIGRKMRSDYCDKNVPAQRPTLALAATTAATGLRSTAVGETPSISTRLREDLAPSEDKPRTAELRIIAPPNPSSIPDSLSPIGVICASGASPLPARVRSQLRTLRDEEGKQGSP